MKKQNNLLAPSKYWNDISNSNPLNLNGCGVGLTTLLVPDSLFGLNISEACNIHDYMYLEGENRKQADDVFLENMISMVNQHSKTKIMKSLRKVKAYIYYYAVKLFGGLIFKSTTKSQEVFQ